jgi:hypothetical protein
MAIFGNINDFKMVRHFNRELIGNVIEQKVGYYKIDLSKTVSNTFDESPSKIYKDPVLVDCLINRSNVQESDSDFGPDKVRNIEFRFFKQDLVCVNIFPEEGDIVLYNENYYEITLKDENQFFLGKDYEYSYDTTTDDFGGSISIILTGHYTRPEKLGLTKERL